MKSILLSSIVLICSFLSSTSLEKEEFLDFFSSKNFFSASLQQKTLKNNQERIISGNLLADRKLGRFKLSYDYPFNELIVSNGEELYIYDEELDQLDIHPVENLLKETPIGLLTLNRQDLKDSFIFEDCLKIKTQISCKVRFNNFSSQIDWVKIKIKNKDLTGFVYKDAFGQIISIDFDNISYQEINDKEFSFEAPSGIDVVRHKSILE